MIPNLWYNLQKETTVSNDIYQNLRCLKILLNLQHIIFSGNKEKIRHKDHKLKK